MSPLEQVVRIRTGETGRTRSERVSHQKETTNEETHCDSCPGPRGPGLRPGRWAQAASAPRRRRRRRGGRCRAAAAAALRRRHADAASAPAAPVANKGDAWMTVVHAAGHPDDRARPGAVLRRPGAQQEHAVGADAGDGDLLADRRAVVHLRLQPGVHRRQRLSSAASTGCSEGPVRPGRRQRFAMARPSARASTSPSCCSPPSRPPSPASPAA